MTTDAGNAEDDPVGTVIPRPFSPWSSMERTVTPVTQYSPVVEADSVT